MIDPFKTNNQIGAGLSAPVAQTLLPVMCGGNGKLHGYITIASTTFNGTESSFTVATGIVVPLASVTLPKHVDNGTGAHVNEYMAAYWDPSQEHIRPWQSVPGFIDTNNTGYIMRHYMPSQGGARAILNKGALVTNLTVSMSAAVTVPATTAAPDVTNAAVAWNARLASNSSQLQFGFFDFNWINLFKTKSSANAVRIEVVSNPATGEFKSTLVPSPVIAPGGGVEYDTVRVIKLKEPAAGTYTFSYKVYDDLGQSTPCTLTLTIT